MHIHYSHFHMYFPSCASTLYYLAYLLHLNSLFILMCTILFYSLMRPPIIITLVHLTVYIMRLLLIVQGRLSLVEVVSLSLSYYFFFLASSLCIKNNTLPVFVLVFSGAINPLTRARIKFWCVGIKLSDLVGIVIDFLCIVRSSRILLWCFILVIMPLSLYFHSLKNQHCGVFRPSKFQIVLLTPLVP
jgi:hypothetical protein